MEVSKFELMVFRKKLIKQRKNVMVTLIPSTHMTMMFISFPYDALELLVQEINIEHKKIKKNMYKVKLGIRNNLHDISGLRYAPSKP